MKEIESFIVEIIENHPCTEMTLTEKISAIYPISIFSFNNGNFASTEVRILLSGLLDNGRILISDDNQIVIKVNQRF